MKTKNLLSKILAWTLTIAMALSVLPAIALPASAAEVSDGTFLI